MHGVLGHKSLGACNSPHVQAAYNQMGSMRTERQCGVIPIALLQLSSPLRAGDGPLGLYALSRAYMFVAS